MSSEHAETLEGIPGRFVPDEMGGLLIESEHLTRYRWASSLVSDKRVLDAGCGTGYGTAMLAAAGAQAVGVDISADVISAAAAGAREDVRFETGDVRDLPYEDARFDVVVCFEVIEHVAEQEAMLAEFARVLNEGGILAVSSPNRDHYPPGNPHHVRELTPAELESQLRRHWDHVRLYPQQNLLSSAIIDPDNPDGIAVYPLVYPSIETSTYIVALASDQPLPDVDHLVGLANPVETFEWLKRFAEQQEELQRLSVAVDEAADREADRARALELLASSEQELARIVELEAEVERYRLVEERLSKELTHARASRDETEQRAARAEAQRRDVIDSYSWKITSPLRLLARLVRNSSR